MAKITDERKRELDRKIRAIQDNGNLNLTTGEEIEMPMGVVFGHGRIFVEASSDLAFFRCTIPSLEKPTKHLIIPLNAQQAAEMGYLLQELAKKLQPLQASAVNVQADIR